MPNLADVDPVAFAQKYPALAHVVALKTTAQAGGNTNDPQTIAKSMFSSSWGQKIQNLSQQNPVATPTTGTTSVDGSDPSAQPGVDQGQQASNFGDTNFLKRYLGNQPTLPNGTPDQQEAGAYDLQSQAKLNQIRAQGILGQEQIAAAQKLDQIGSLDSAAYMASELKKRDVTSDIDARLLNLRMSAITSDAILRGQLNNLDPSIRDQKLNDNAANYKSIEDQLNDIRSTRVETAKGQIQDEIDAHNQAYQAAKDHADALTKLEDTIKTTGDNQDALASISLAKAQALKKLQKLSGSSTPLPVQNIANYILQDYQDKGGTVTAAVTKQANDLAKQAYARRKAAGYSDDAASSGDAQAGKIRSDAAIPTPTLKGGLSPTAKLDLRIKLKDALDKGAISQSDYDQALGNAPTK